MKQRLVCLGSALLLSTTGATAITSRAVQPWSDLRVHAETAIERGEPDKAEAFLKLAIFVASLFKDDASLIELNDELAQFYFDEGHYGEAEDCYVKSIALTSSVCGEKSASLGREYAKLSELYAAENLFDLARTFNEKSLDTLIKSPDATTFENGVAAHNQAWLEEQAECGDQEEAEKFYTMAFRKFANCDDKSRILCGLTANSLAEMYTKQQRYVLAEKWYRTTLRYLNKPLKGQAILTRVTNNFIYVLLRNQKVEEAEKVQLGVKGISQ